MRDGHHATPPDGDDYTYDLRTLPEHEAVRFDRLQEALTYLTKRVDELTSAAMTDLGNISHQIATLREAVDGAVRIATTAERQAAAHERRIGALEGTVKALERTAAGHADTLQVLLLRADDGK